MKKTAVFAGIILLTAGLMVLTTGCAKKKTPPQEDKIGRLIQKFSESLDLTEAQKAKVEEIKKEIADKNEQARNERKDEGKEVDEAFKKELSKDKFDPAVINKLLDQKVQKREDQRRFMVAELAKFHAMLTPEQKKKLAGIIKEMGPEPKKDGEPRPPRPEQGPEKGR
jgi:Spy/CpxP family protein refolding chaperone